MPTRFLDVDDYLASLDPIAGDVMRAARAQLHAVLPGCGETISYGMPTFTLDGHAFLYVGAWKRHLGVYPVPNLDDGLEADVAPYRSTPDTLRFPYRQGVPFDLLGRVALAVAAARRTAG